MDNAIDKCNNSRQAAMITSNTIAIGDALEVLKLLAGMESMVRQP
jgi:hypothetical protein